MPYIEDALEKLNDVNPEILLTVDGAVNVANIEKVAQQHGIDTGVLSLACIFLTVGDLTIEKTFQFIKDRLEVTADLAERIAADFKNQVFYPLKKRIDFLNSNPNKEMSIDEEKKIIYSIFLNGYLSEMNNHPLIRDAVNHRIFFVFYRDMKFRDELVRVFLDNTEELTKTNLVFNDKTWRGTVGNWLKSFISVNGSDIFDSVILSKFLANSKNIEKLSEEDKVKVKQIIVTYRNLKFFPDSMPDGDGDDWQILPFDIPSPEPEEDGDDQGDFVDVDKQAEKESRINELKILLAKYPEGSLARRAVEEEIKRLKNPKS